MTDESISALASYATYHSDDLLILVDVHDTTMSSSGTDKKSTIPNLISLAGIVSTGGSYSNPAWLTAISGGIVSGNIAGNAASINGSITRSQISDLGTYSGGTSITTLGTIATGTVPGANVSGNIAGNAASITGSITNSQVSDLGSWAGSTALVTQGTITTGTWHATAIGVGYGGTGLTSIGTASQILGVNTGATGLEYKTLSAASSNIVVTPTAGSITVGLSATPSVTTLTSSGATTAGSLSVASGNHAIDSYGHVLSAGSTPTNVAGTGAGTSPTVTITGNDVAGYITILTGSSPAGSGAIVTTITFANAYASTPKVVFLTAINNAAQGKMTSLVAYLNDISTGGWILRNTSGTALAATTTYILGYLVVA